MAHSKKKPITVKVLGPNGKWIVARDENALVSTGKALQKKLPLFLAVSPDLAIFLSTMLPPWYRNHMARKNYKARGCPILCVLRGRLYEQEWLRTQRVGKQNIQR